MNEDKSIVINSIIGHGTTYSGNLESIDLLRIDGNFSGIARSQDVILVGENGKAKGTLVAPKIIIAGVFDGTIENCQLVILQSSAIVIGEIKVKDVIVESGAIVSGALRTPTLQSRLAQMENGLENKASTETQTRTTGKFSTKMLEKLFTV